MAWFPYPSVKVVRAARAAQLCALLAVAAASVGFGAGWQVRAWREAQADLKDERAERGAHALETARRGALAEEHEMRRDQIESSYREADRDLAEFVRARPELWACDVGADGLRLIEGWDAAGAGRAGQPSAPVSDAAAEPAERRGAAPAREPEGP